ncbi:hypothetical protein EDB84DRAFT_914139 [Lactarius hengduanensis]|nr:hypothetical protein EDB84DRAFT_914139 [Lactarius hengduanensis]
MRGVIPFCRGAMIGQRSSMDGTRVAKSQGSRSQTVSVEMAVVRAPNVPHLKTTFGGKREFFVTVTYGVMKKTKKQTKKRTKSVHSGGRTARWDQRLDALCDFLLFNHFFFFWLKAPISFLQLPSQRILRFHAKRLTKSDLLIGTPETAIPAESKSDISVILGHGNGQAGHTSWVRSVGFSPDGQRIDSGSDDGAICVWNATTGDAEAGPPSRDTGSVMSVPFSPNGKRIISGCFDQTIRLMNATTGDTEPVRFLYTQFRPFHGILARWPADRLRLGRSNNSCVERHDGRHRGRPIYWTLMQYRYAHI